MRRHATRYSQTDQPCETGVHGDLKVTMQRYEAQVTCWDLPGLQDLDDCYVALQSMPATKKVIKFGRVGVDSDYILPKTFTNRK